MFDRLKKGLWWDAALRVNSGCTKVSAGCDHCWAESEARIRSKSPNKKIRDQWPGDFEGDVVLLPDNIEKVLAEKKPKAWAVWNDLFHKSVPLWYIEKVLATFALRPDQLGIIPTKRPERLRAAYGDLPNETNTKLIRRAITKCLNIPEPVEKGPWQSWPLNNIWLGTSAENQAALEERAGHLLKCKASLLFLSLEPCLGQMDIEDYIRKPQYEAEFCESRECGGCVSASDDPCMDWEKWWEEANNKIGWVIVGAESRGGAAGRPCDIEWVRKIVYQCKAAGVPVFVKQLHIEGKLVKELEKFPEVLRLRETPALAGEVS